MHSRPTRRYSLPPRAAQPLPASPEPASFSPRAVRLAAGLLGLVLAALVWLGCG